MFLKKLGKFLEKLGKFFKNINTFSCLGADWITLPDPIISSFPFILTFQSKHTVYQTVKNDSTSPHPRFSRAFQVPSQSAFRAHNAILVFYEWKEAERAMTRCSFMTGSLSTGDISTANERREEETIRLIRKLYNNKDSAIFKQALSLIYHKKHSHQCLKRITHLSITRNAFQRLFYAFSLYQDAFLKRIYLQNK